MNKELRRATAESVQQYRLTKMLPIYEAAELKSVVDAWYPILESVGVKPQYLPDLFVFALARQTRNKIFGADDLAKSWAPFIERKRAQAWSEYQQSVEGGIEDPNEAWKAYLKRVSEM